MRKNWWCSYRDVNENFSLKLNSLKTKQDSLDYISCQQHTFTLIKNDCLNPGLIFVCTPGLVLLSLRQCSPLPKQWQIGTNKNSLAKGQ